MSIKEGIFCAAKKFCKKCKFKNCIRILVLRGNKYKDKEICNRCGSVIK